MSLKVNFKRKISVRVSENKIILTVPVIRNYFILALLLFISCIWFTKSFRFLYSHIPDVIENFDVPTVVILSIWLVFSFLLVKWLIWCIYGAETIFINSDFLIIQTRGKLFNKKRVFETKKINWIKLDTIDNRLNNEFQTDNKGNLIEEGKIRFKYNYQLDDKGLGEGLTINEAIEFLDLLALKGFIDEKLWVYKKPTEGDYYE